MHYEKIKDLDGRCTLATNQAAHMNTMNNIAERRIEELEFKCSNGDGLAAHLNQRAHEGIAQAKAEA